MHLPRSASVATVTALAVLTLAACNKGKEPPMDNPPAPPDLAANFSQPIDAKAADGSWTLKVRGDTMTLTRYSQPDLTFTAPGAMIQPHQATWIAKLADNQTVTVKIYASPCVYPATTENHAFAAEVDLPNTAPLSGCGDPAGAPRAAVPVAAPKK